jgi:hypothetical protein
MTRERAGIIVRSGFDGNPGIRIKSSLVKLNSYQRVSCQISRHDDLR